MMKVSNNTDDREVQLLQTAKLENRNPKQCNDLPPFYSLQSNQSHMRLLPPRANRNRFHRFWLG